MFAPTGHGRKRRNRRPEVPSLPLLRSFGFLRGNTDLSKTPQRRNLIGSPFHSESSQSGLGIGAQTDWKRRRLREPELQGARSAQCPRQEALRRSRSEEHTSELQSRQYL